MFRPASIFQITFSAMVLSLGGIIPVSAQDTPAQQLLQSATEQLLEATRLFNGAGSLAQIEALVNGGADVNIIDSKGNTPLHYLCQPLEMDYRYRTEPHFRNSVDKAILFLLSKGANALQEDAKGCNPFFFMQSKPELLAEMERQKLMPPVLAIRIPYYYPALSNYMHKRMLQASCTTHAECRDYLIRKYCAPAYERVLTQIEKYRRAEHTRGIPEDQLETHLRFLLLADEKKACEYVESLPWWDHSEHFLEDVPELFLLALSRCNWPVNPAKLRTALEKLDSLLPQNDEDMIDCVAARPMAHLLRMLAAQDAESATALINKYANSRDHRLVYAALSIQLRARRLPLPEPDELRLWQNQKATPLTREEQLLVECAEVDECIREIRLTELKPDQLQRVAEHLRAKGLTAHADLLDKISNSVDQTQLRIIPAEYDELHGDSPRIIMARYILNHPESFSISDQ